jgi:ABC-type nitrate/sulfonate/bicarbonate transport system substrate-binding protein
VEFKLINEALGQGNAEAAFNTDVFTAQAIRSRKARYLVKYPLQELVMNPFFNGGGFVSSKALASNSKMVADTQAAFEEALQFIRQNNREARLMMKKYVPVDTEDLLSAELDDFISTKQVNTNNANKLANIFFKKGLAARKIDVRSLLYNASSTGKVQGTARGGTPATQ